MALPSFLKRNAPAAPAPDDATIVQNARTRARRRLIGAAVLLGIGVISFPLLFETQPRPIPVDIPIVIPPKDGLPPLSPPARVARAASGQVAEGSAKPVLADRVAAAPAPASSVALPKAAAQPAPAAAPKPAMQAPPAASSPIPAVVKPKPAASAPAPRLPASAPPFPAPPEAGRFVVQVGAFADATAAREIRLKLEKLGLKTYTQIVETAQGKRIRVRVGPFDKADEAAKVLDRLKAAKLPGAVLTL